jgi:glycosyltransferase involved in cell wall biosynthesis
VKTLLVCPALFASHGGIERILRLYLKALCELAAPADRVALAVLNDAALIPAQVAPFATRALARVSAAGKSRIRFILRTLLLARGADRLVCGHIGQLSVALLARKLNPRLRYYLVAHGIEVWRPFTTLEQAALRGAHRILCVSDFTRREVLSRLRLAPERAVVLPNALDPAFTIAAGRPLADSPPVILCVTRLLFADRYKGVENLIAALPAVRASIPDAVLRIVGHGDDVARLTALRDQLGLGPAVEFTGFVDDRRLESELRGCRLFALPSTREGFGLVFLEAMARGRPCLAARAGGAPEVLTPETGILVAADDSPALARGLVDGLSRHWDEERILARAREFSYSPFKSKLASLLAA